MAAGGATAEKIQATGKERSSGGDMPEKRCCRLRSGSFPAAFRHCQEGATQSKLMLIIQPFALSAWFTSRRFGNSLLE
jgi:hypothetical protein